VHELLVTIFQAFTVDSFHYFYSWSTERCLSLFRPSIKFTAEISESEITFLDTIIYKGDIFQTDYILDIKTHYKPTETFQYTPFTSCHPPGVKRGFIKGVATRLLRTNSSQTTFEECLSNFKLRLKARGYPNNFI